MAALPKAFETIQKGLAEWNAAAVKRHQAIEEASSGEGDLVALEKQHSLTGTDDPLELAQFACAVAEKDEQHIKALQKKAITSKAEVESFASSEKQAVAGYVKSDKGLDLPKLAQDLKQVTDQGTEKVKAASAQLGEISSQDKAQRKSQGEILSSKFSSEQMGRMDDTQRVKEHKKLHLERIEKRQDVAAGVAATLCGDGMWKDTICSALKHQEAIAKVLASTDSLNQKSLDASQGNRDMEAIVEALEDAKASDEQKLLQCELHHDTLVRQKEDSGLSLAANLNQLQAILQQSQEQEKVHCDLNTKVLASRIQMARLKGNSKKTSERLSSAKKCLEPSKVDGEIWRTAAESHRDALRELIGEEVENNKERVKGALQAADFNIELSRTLINKVKEEISAEHAHVAGKLENCKAKLEEYQEAMESEDIDDPILVQGNIAQVETEQKSLGDQLDKCNKMRERLETGLKAAEDQSGALAALQTSLGCMPMDATERDCARDPADDCYEKFTLWGKGSANSAARRRGSPAACASSGALALSHADIARMVKREARQMFDQWRADLMFRPGSPSSSAAVSDVRDYVFPPETEVFSMVCKCGFDRAACGACGQGWAQRAADQQATAADPPRQGQKQ
eukprot:CAMPEP_0203932476 /NCGR_PEP_ID=MMETSP0359-20131031/70857_1 /ASSEMBLY_ACC=CAM_ASM_000338 /TAXON_ID=268821 /ORGANISM="Scrippsiella Hangoei, Strain SHTV-5" /LENGTH=626 /DNA_ID=CAMNT_0050861921 /DNA_START=38 /DNA_END=1918 /DNA_ORIENTATION=-